MIEPDRGATPAITVSDVSLTYAAHGGARAHHAIDGVSFILERGQVLALLGESGAGKSTLAKFLAGRARELQGRRGLLRVSGGAATVLGVPMRQLKRRTLTRLTAHVALLTQDAGATLPADLNVGDILLQPISERVKEVDREQFAVRIAEMMQTVALPLRTLRAYPYELSKGQRQRVAVMRSLMLDPALLIADEPTLGVDATNRPRIVELLRQFRQRTGASMLVVSHDIGLLEALVHEVLVLQQGRVVGAGSIDTVFRQADHGYVRRLASALRATAYDEVVRS